MSRTRTAVSGGLRLIERLLLVAVLLGSVAFIVPKFLGYERYVITGKSMAGTYDLGSVVFDKPVPVASLKVGDVITYLPPSESRVTNLVTHRIHSISQDSDGTAVYRTKGDNNPQRDPWTFRMQQPLQPRVDFAVPYVGHVFIALADRRTRMLAIGGPAAVIALIALVELGRALRPRRSPQDAQSGATDESGVSPLGA